MVIFVSFVVIFLVYVILDIFAAAPTIFCFSVYDLPFLFFCCCSRWKWVVLGGE